MITPTSLWNDYKRAVYYDGDLAPIQEREVSSAFYAGIEAVFKFIDNSDPNEHDDITTARLVLFRRQNKVAALQQNVTGEN